MNKFWTFGDSFTAGHGCKYDASGAFSNNFENYYKKLYDDYIDISKKIWPEIVADKLNMELANYAKNGMTNESIADITLKHIPDMKIGDIVILQTSTFGRYEFPFLKEKSLMGHTTNNSAKEYDSIDDSISPFFFKTIFLTNIENEYSDEMKNVLLYNNGQESLKNKNVILDESKYNTIRNFFVQYLSTERYHERNVWRIAQISKILKSIGIESYVINEMQWPSHLSVPTNLIQMHKNGIFGHIYENKKNIKSDTNGLIDDLHPSYDGHIDIADFVINYIKNENINIHHT